MLLLHTYTAAQSDKSISSRYSNKIAAASMQQSDLHVVKLKNKSDICETSSDCQTVSMTRQTQEPDLSTE